MFPKNFVWGAATASYQIEGGWDLDGKGPSIWDEFTHTPGKIKNGDTGNVACDHVHRYREDVALMKQMGLKAYRLSVSWPRVLPEGVGAANEKGLQFYSDLVDELLANGIEPYVTLYHWDLPLRLQEQGGWINRDSAKWFADYTEIVAQKLGDRVKHFCTFNETSVFTKGLINGNHAPGLKMTPNYYIKAYHNTLRAHGRAVQVLRRVVPDAEVGIAPSVLPFVPKTEADIEACRQMTFSGKRKVNGNENPPIDEFLNAQSMLLDPIMFGTYPEDGLSLIGPYLPDNWQADMELIRQPIDFIAFNVYKGRVAVDDGAGGIRLIPPEPGYARTAFDWVVTPECIYWMSRFLWERYHMPMYVSENGIATHDWVSLDGKVHDPNRIDYLNRHLLQLEKAMDEGVDIRGYFQWSLMDNFEWAYGFYERFGLIFVDYTTQKRTLKDSAMWYRKVIETNGVKLHEFD